ncbi:hypothetical protein PEC18_37535 [Paucibacter sp. O1-1]|nr:hypothetical protein [Paucibacter sp. O1-1]MDA3831351.1 hypothetical protein [Paucibacter sp. O1-1]
MDTYLKAGADVVESETHHSALELSVSSLQLLGYNEEYVMRRKATYKRIEKEASNRLYNFWLKESAGERFSNDFIKLFMLYEERLKQAMEEDNAVNQDDVENRLLPENSADVDSAQVEGVTSNSNTMPT